MRSRVVAVLGLVAVTTLLVSGCSGGSSYTGNPGGPKVGIVGDSITNLLKPDLKSAVGSRYRYVVKARDGKRIDQQLDELRSLLHGDDPPQRLIVNLGTNDVLQGRSDALGHLDRELQLVADVDCVILVTINPNADDGDSHLAEKLNDAMKGAVASLPNFHLLDWAGLLAADPHRAEQWLSDFDAVHPSAAGSQALAAQYRQALDQDCAAVPATPPA
jgi:lysophospholipase L1-like esterase